MAVELLDDRLQEGILLDAGSCVPLVAAYDPMFALSLWTRKN